MNPRMMMLMVPWLVVACRVERGGQAAVSEPVQAVLVEPVRWTDEALPVHATARLRRKTEAVLSFKIAGIVAEVPVRAGDTVRKGQVLAELRQEEIESQVAQARAAAADTQRRRERLASLLTRRAVSQQDAEDAATRAEVAAAVLRAAEFNRRFSRITAPADGRILRRRCEPDETVAAGAPVLEFASETDGWIATARVTESEAARLRAGDRAELALTALGGKAVAAEVTQIAGSSDAVTRTVEVEMRLTSGSPAVNSGFLAHAAIRPQAVAPRPLVPLSALVDGEGLQAALFLVATGQPAAERVAVEIEAITPQGALLRSPLEPNRLLVTAGADFLRDGSALELRQAVRSTATAANHPVP